MLKLGKLNSMWGATLVICITIVITSLATATAASLINGKRLKNGTVTGKKLKKNTLTGTQINESKLGKVPSAVSADNAGTLGGLSASAFAQGNTRIVADSAAASISTANTPLLDIPGWGKLLFDCDALGTAYPKFENLSGATLKLAGATTSLTDTNALTSPYSTGVANNTTAPIQSRDGGSTTFQAWDPGTKNKNLTVILSDVGCSFTATAFATG